MVSQRTDEALGLMKFRYRRSKKLPRSFYLRPTTTVAKELLGKYLVRNRGRVRLVGRIVETEAYCEGDPASHSFSGRTRRNDVMFWSGGHLYVYFTYGMHFCANVTTWKEGTGEAVLIRAIEPVDGVEVMIKNRFGRKSRTSTPGTIPRNLANGPAKLCQALRIQRGQNGTDLLGEEIYVLDAPALPGPQVGASARVGIQKGKEKKWRFFERGSAWLSR